MGGIRNLGFLAGRILIGSNFIVSAVTKSIAWSKVADTMVERGVTMVPLFLTIALLIEFLGGCCILFGYKTRWAALILFLLLIPVTLIFHDFWAVNYSLEAVMNFMKNLAIMGGLLYVAVVGSGRIGFDQDHREHKHH